MPGPWISKSVFPSLVLLVAFTQVLQGDPRDGAIGPSGVSGTSLLNTGKSSSAENRALARALRESANSLDAEPGKPLAEFLERYPDSGWRASLLANLGTSYRATGRFTKALDAFEEAWTLTSGGSSKSERLLANWALGELLAMHSHLGHSARLQQLFAAADARDIHGPTTEQLTGARESLWLKQHNPEMSARCGPMALARIAQSMGIGEDMQKMLRNAPATASGMSLAQLESLAGKAGMRMIAARRGPGADLVAPAVVHWKVDHYSAIVERKMEGGREYFLVENPLFEKEMWVSREALDEETSGYYLIPAGPLPPGWQAVWPEEAAKIWGRCRNGQRDPTQTMLCADMVGSSCPSVSTTDPVAVPLGAPIGMATYAFHTMLVSLHIADEPLGYTPPVGPAVRFRITYNQRDASQQKMFTVSNLGRKWTFDWLSYVTDSGPASAAYLYPRAGGQEVYVNSPVSNVRSTSTPGALYTYYYNYDYQSHAQLVSNYTLNGQGGTDITVHQLLNYQRLLPDGSKEIFGQVRNNDPSPGQRTAYLTQIVDPAGNTVKLTYDSGNRIVSVTDALGQVTTLSYGLASDPLKVTKVTDPFGRSATLTYNGENQLASTTDSMGIRSQFTYGSNDFVSSLTTPYGTTSFTTGVAPGIDPIGGVNNSLEATDPLGGTEHLEFRFYDPTVNGGIPGAGEVIGASLYWDKRAWKLAPGDPKAATVVNWAVENHLSIGLRYYTQRPLENRVTNSYATIAGTVLSDGNTSGEPNFIGLPAMVTTTLDDGTVQTYKAGHNPLGKPTQLIDPLNRITSLSYDTTGIDLLQAQNGNTNEVLARITYNSQHLPLTYTDESGQTSTFTYNPKGQLLTATDALRETTTFAYDSNGYLTSVTGPLPGAVNKFTYDRFGRVQTATDQLGYTLTYQYDALDRVTQVTYPDGTVSGVVYNVLDPVTLTDRLGRKTTVTYDAVRHPISVTDPLGQVTTYTWCNCGSLMQLTDPAGNTTTWNRDIEGRITSKVMPDGSTTQYQYGASGRLIQMVNPKGQAIRYQYDAAGSLLQVNYADASTPASTFTYDKNWNRVTGITDGSGTSSYTYNKAGSLGGLQVASKLGSAGETIVYTYDALGRAVSRAIDGVKVSQTFDPLGEVTGETNPLGQISYQYLGATGQLQSVHYPNGQSTAFTYFGNQGDQRLQQIKNSGSGGTLLSQFDHTYSATGEIQTLTRQLPALWGIPTVFQFSYDDDTQLVGATLAGTDGSSVAAYGYAYDQAGNRTAEQINGNLNPATFNNLNQIGTPFTYDADGNVLSDGLRVFEWDAEDRLLSVSMGTHRSEFTYDGMSRRTRIVEKESGIVMNDKRLIWCGSSICEERDAVAGMTKRFFGLGETQTANGATTSYFYTSDALGSIREMTDSSGNLAASYDYDPWGRVNKLSGSTADAAFGFAGYYVHAPSGLYLTQYRAYDPNFGRWLSRDPLGEDGGVNLYGYVVNDPINATDPLGLCDPVGDYVRDWWKGVQNPKTWLKILKDPKKPWKPFVPKVPSPSPLPTDEDVPEGALQAGLAANRASYAWNMQRLWDEENVCPANGVQKWRKDITIAYYKNILAELQKAYKADYKQLQAIKAGRNHGIGDYDPPNRRPQ